MMAVVNDESDLEQNILRKWGLSSAHEKEQENRESTTDYYDACFTFNMHLWIELFKTDHN